MSSIEKIIEELKEAVEANTEALNALNKIASAGNAGKSKAKDEDEDGKGKGKDKAKDKDKDKGNTEAAVRKGFADFLETDDAKERKARKKFVADVLEKLDAENVAAIEEGDRKKALKWLKEREDDEDFDLDD